MIAARRRAPDPLAFLLVALLALVALAWAGCGATAPTVARKTVTAADEIQVAGMSSFVEADLLHQEAIAGSDEPLEVRRQKIAEYRTARSRVLSGFSAVAAASHAARATIDAYEAGTLHSVAWGDLVQAVLSSAEALRGAADAIGIKVTGLDALLGGRP